MTMVVGKDVKITFNGVRLHPCAGFFEGGEEFNKKPIVTEVTGTEEDCSMATFEYETEEDMEKDFEYYMELQQELIDLQMEFSATEKELEYIQEEINRVEEELKEYE